MSKATTVLQAQGGMGTAPIEDTVLNRPLVLRWDILALVVIVLVGGVLRFWDLGSRAYHHDESLHAVYSWYLYTGKGYVHDPLMHGPFQYHGTA